MPNFDPSQPLPPGAEDEPDPTPANEFDYLRQQAIARPTEVPPSPLQATPADVAAAQAAGVTIAPSLLPPQAPPIAPPAPPVVAPVAEVPAAPAGPTGGGGGAPASGDTGVGEIKAAGQESTQVGRDAAKLAEDRARADADADRARANEAQASANRLSALQATQKKAYDDSVAQFQQARADVANYKFPDHFANKSNAQIVLAGVGMLLGGASFDGHHVNQAVQLIQSGFDRDSKQQIEFLHSKEHLADLANQGVRDTQAYLAHEMANFQTAEAFKKEAVAAQIDDGTSTVRGKQNVIAAQQVAAKLREQAAKDQQAAIIQSTHNRVMQSEIALNRAKAANEGVARVGKVQTAAEQAAEKVVASRLKDNKTVTTLLKEKEELDKANSASVPDPKTGRVNGTAFQAAVDGFTKAVTGLGARQSSIATTTGAFGGIVDKVRRNVQKGIDGEYTAHDVAVFREGLDKIQKGNSLSLQTSRKLDEQAFARHPLTKGQKDVYQTALDQRYGGAQDATPAAPSLRPDQVERLKAIPANDPEYARAQQLLKAS